MNKQQLQQVFLDQQEMFGRAAELISREVNLTQCINTRQTVIITGVRRCGKSSLLRLIRDQMELKDSDCCYFNFDDERIPNDSELLNRIYELHIELHGKEPVFFLDEVQNITGWQKFVNRMYEKGLKLFVTGSNANLLSAEIATYLTGRHKTITLFPFSFSEFLSYKKMKLTPGAHSTKQSAQARKLFKAYLNTGGFPLAVIEDDPDQAAEYFRDILYRDIVARHGITGVEEIKQLGIYLVSNASRLFTYQKLQVLAHLKSKSTVKNYLDYYRQAFLFYYLKKFDYSLKKQMFNPQKVYTVDTALIHKLGFKNSPDYGRLLENVVYLQLLRRGVDVFYFSGRGECDFILQSGHGLSEAIQVVWSLTDANKDRELNGLQEASETYDIPRKTLLYVDIETDYPDDPSLQVMPVWDWALVC